MKDYLYFDHELTVEVNSLPTLSRQHILSISIPIEATTIQDYTGPLLVTDSLSEAKRWRVSEGKTLGLDLGSIPTGVGADKPLEERPTVQVTRS